MQNVIKSFEREGPGRWRCIVPCDFISPVGRVQVAVGTTVMRGTQFMGYDLAAMLDAEYERQRKAQRS